MAKKETMTSRQRLEAALNHQLPDRVPIDLGGFQTGIHKAAYKALLDYLGMEDELTILDPVQQLARPCEELLKRFRVDTRYLCAHAPEGFKGGVEVNKRDGRVWHDLKDEFGVIWSMPDDQQLYMDISHHPLAQATVQTLREYPFPKGNDPTRFTGLREEALRLRRDSPYAICTGIGGVVYEICWYMRGLERWFIDMKENPAFCEALLDRTLQFWLDYYSGLLAEVGDLVDIVVEADDLGGQNAPLMSPVTYRRLIKPRHQRLFSFIKAQAPVKVFYHTCGAVRPLIPDLIEAGIDILNPVQISAADMDLVELKREFGRELVFWGGGADTQRVLGTASPEEIRDHVRDNIEAMAPGGGFVFAAVHDIQANVPPENIMATWEAWQEFGVYA